MIEFRSTGGFGVQILAGIDIEELSVADECYNNLQGIQRFFSSPRPDSQTVAAVAGELIPFLRTQRNSPPSHCRSNHPPNPSIPSH